ncbi:acetyl-CoA synthetase-like protein [Lentithecium fluviatile CBS 122367]|uniref:Acetyl-CoA synthetase-like protein n=1 Tax=Lentithecium fluviatile CBS 122367 TaxID=1168545 RepID=A0A6G1IPZ4_9PLEO|nr:acetyl-CoA synthetase-like protein [Lentithecium fluviatile CBS 122367]
MSPTATHIRPSFGNRTLPQALDDLASFLPDRLHASIPKDRDLSSGFVDVSCRDISRCVNFMAHWIDSRLGPSAEFDTLAYIGIPDLRFVAVFLGAVKCGYKVLLPSPRNTPATNSSLMQQTGCMTVLHTAEVAAVAKTLVSFGSILNSLEVPSFEEIVAADPQVYPFNKDSALVRKSHHTRYLTKLGMPKPITMTHATFAVLDKERHLPTVPGRRNRDYSIWDFNGGGNFYTVFPYFHLAGFCLLVNPIFTEASSPVLGPPLMPPSGALLKAFMRHHPLRALYLPPSIAEQLLMEPGGLDFFKDLHFLCYTGGPFSPSAGEQLSKVTELCPLYGSTEAFQERSRSVLLIEPKGNVSEEQLSHLSNAIWPIVEEANRLLPAQGRILRGSILVARREKPFARAGKGTIVRRLMAQLYESEIVALYDENVPSQAAPLPSLGKASDMGFDATATTFFSAGLDSVMIGQLLSNLKSGLKESSPTRNIEWLNTRTVYQHSSVGRLSEILTSFLNTGQIPGEATSQSRVSAMEDLVQKYTQGLDQQASNPKTGAGPKATVLVGSTGYLDPFILASLFNSPTTHTIICLNHSSKSQNTSKPPQLPLVQGDRLSRLHFLTVNLDAPNLALPHHDFIALSNTATTIIYNAWKPDFNLPLHSFSNPFLTGLRSLIDLSLSSPRRPRIAFVSSIAAVGNWSTVFPDQSEIPELPVEDVDVALHMGYGESKCVAERNLRIAHEECGVDVDILRVGQIGGSSGGERCKWPVQVWLRAMMRTSRVIGKLPVHVAPVDWIPVDVLAGQIASIVGDVRAADLEYHVFNLVHPGRVEGDVFLDTLINRFRCRGGEGWASGVVGLFGREDASE